MLQGTATYLPPHIQAAQKGPERPLNVTEVTANQINGDNGGNQDRQDQGANQKKGRFTVRTFTDIQPRTSTWLLDGVLPDDDLTVFIGEEGIGKGLYAADVIARVTKAGHNVLIIATEDDFERVLRPRLDVAGAVLSRCITMIADPDTLQGQPNLLHNRLEVEAVINEYKVRLVYIDPWVSSVSGGLRLQNTQDARSAIDPLLSMARASHCSVLAVAHPNRGEGDLRARVGLSAVLRQAARLLLFAIEPPDDDTKLIIGIEKANETGRAPASVYRKLPKKHPTLAKPVWAVEEITDAPRLTIRQWHDQYRTDRDHRRSDRWPSVLAAWTAWFNGPTSSPFTRSLAPTREPQTKPSTGG
jgi:AAA domain